MSDKVTMTALDTVHISNVRSENIEAGDVFTVSEADAKVLEKSGVAERGGAASKAVNVESLGIDDDRQALEDERAGLRESNTKAINAAPANKAESAAPTNKITTTTTARKRK